MKKKLIAIFLCVALVAVGVVGATIAYFTDEDQAKNTFAVGDIDIKLTETAGVYDADENKIEGCFEANDDGGYTYSNLMAGYKIQKTPVIKNVGHQPAYVRVAVVMNNLAKIDAAIDGVYEKKGYEAEAIQAIYDKVFDGWDVNYEKRETNGRRMWMDKRIDTKVLFEGQVDMIGKSKAGYAMVDMQNTFQTLAEAAKWTNPSTCDGILNVTQDDPEGYYWNAAQADERVYVFYLKLDPNESYTLFDGLNVPAEFTQEQAEMFDGLTIGIYADAIQTAGFTTAEDAFNALEAAHSLGWWN